MAHRRPVRLVLGSVTMVATACGGPQDVTTPGSGDRARLPPGFTLSIWADNLVRPRSLTLGDDGTVYVGTYYYTKGVQSPVLALRDRDGDGRADWSREIWSGFNTPNGVAYNDGTLYIVDEDRVLRIDDVEGTLEDPRPRLVYSGLPSRAETEEATDKGHWWRYLTYGPDDRLYISVGTRWSFWVGAHTANDADDPEVYSSIVSMNPDGSGFEIFADGVRNAMGLTFHPETGELWFTDNGPSWPFEDPRTYDIPADEINRADDGGLHFGFPFVHARLPDPLIGSLAPSGHREPAHELAAHSAPLGLRFYTGDMFPARYRNQLFVAEHGTEPTTPAAARDIHGDRISVVYVDQGGRVVGYEPFLEGWFDPANAVLASNARYSRRPVDLLVLTDGSLLVSDDWSGTIYRITYTD